MLIKSVILVFILFIVPTNVVYSRIYNIMFIFMAFHLKFSKINSNNYMHNKFKYKNVGSTYIYFNIYIAILFYSKDKMFN